MSWRTVYITSHSHLSFTNGFLTIRGEETKQIHISEIHTVIIDSNLITVSMYLLNELMANKVKVVICNEKHNPNMELIPYYGAYDTSKVIGKEVNWKIEYCQELWKTIIKYKILYQSQLLKKYDIEKSNQLLLYVNDIKSGDITNREGHAAKVYFNALFGNSFSRNDDQNPINAFLNYGYSIILSMVNREVVSNGYITQIGIHHRGPKNPFNLSCDLMEIFRPIIDEYAKEHEGEEFTKSRKIELIDIMNSRFNYDGKKQFLANIVGVYVNRTLLDLENGFINEKWFLYE